MAARTQPTNLRRRSVVLAIVVAATLGLPAGASAHSGTLVNALDFRAQVTSVGSGGTAISAAIIDGDRKLELHVPPTTTVVVLGYAGEPLLRFSRTGVTVNERSPSAISDRLAKRGSVPALDPNATPAWSSVSSGHSYAWHDHRLGPTPGRSYPQGNVAGWTIPIVVDGHRETITGRLLHARGPSLWPWLGLLGITLVGAVLATRSRNRELVRTALFAGATVAGLAAVVLSVSFGFAPGRATSAGWTNLAVSSLIGLVALALFARAPSARHGVAGFVAVLAALVGLSEASVLVHGFVISELPAAVVRAATAVAASIGAFAAACAAALLLRDERGRRATTQRNVHVQMAIPRGRPR